MQNLRELRIERGLSQAELAKRCNISRQRLSAYENGSRRIPAGIAEVLAEQLEIPRPADKGKFLGIHQHRRLGGWTRWRSHKETNPTWGDFSHVYQDLFRRLPEELLPDLEFRQRVRCDSGLEALAWAQLCCAGARPVLASPTLFDFTRYFLSDGQGRALGVRAFPALLWEGERSSWIVWPQMTLALPARSRRFDGLLRATQDGRGSWGLVEIDGGAHRNADWDLRRDAEVDLPVLRFAGFEIQGLSLAALWDRQIRERLWGRKSVTGGARLSSEREKGPGGEPG